MNAGKLDRRILVQVRTVTRDATGGRVEAWATAFSCWAGLLKDSGRVEQVADAERPGRARSFLIRWRSDIQPGTHRISYQGKVFTIDAITEEGRKESLIIECRQLEGLSL